MPRHPLSPPLKSTFEHVYQTVAQQPNKRTPELVTTGGVRFVAEAKETTDRRRFVSLPHINRIYEEDWGFTANSMGKDGQRIGQYAVPLDEWVRSLETEETQFFETGQLPPHVYRATGTRGEVAFTANDIQARSALSPQRECALDGAPVQTLRGGFGRGTARAGRIRGQVPAARTVGSQRGCRNREKRAHIRQRY